MSIRSRSRFVLLSSASAATFWLVMLSATSARAQQAPAAASPPPGDFQEYPPPSADQAAYDPAAAGDPGQDAYQEGAPPADYADQGNDSAPLIPPNVEAPAYAASDGNYCYVGPHPVDTRVMPGGSWDGTQGQHMRPYPPIDTRLFAYRDGCYYFTGDPRDFGYGGQTYAYYGAHPILDGYGGGWCFMMGPHTHIWAPWSPQFTVVGSWYYWHGPFDPFFWTYWPYYSLYYRSYYPSYYGGGRFYRGGGWRVAPAIRPMQVQAWRGNALHGAAPVYRGGPPAGTVRGAVPGGNVYHGPAGPTARGFSPPAGGQTPGPGFHPAQPAFRPAQPGFNSGQPSFRAAPPAFHSAPPAYRPGPPPSFRGGGPAYSPPPSFRAPSAPSRPSFSPGAAPRSFSPPGGGFHGGGGFHRR